MSCGPSLNAAALASVSVVEEAASDCYLGAVNEISCLLLRELSVFLCFSQTRWFGLPLRMPMLLALWLSQATMFLGQSGAMESQ